MEMRSTDQQNCAFVSTSVQQKKETVKSQVSEFTDILLSWSLEDVLNQHLYQHKIEKIPDSFESIERYFGSYYYLLLEETRAQLCSSLEIISTAPFTEVISIKECEPYGTGLYDCKVNEWLNGFSRNVNEPYKTSPGDVFILADDKPDCVSDLNRICKSWSFASLHKISEDESKNGSTFTYKLKASVTNWDMIKKSMFVVFLINVLPNKRIWNALQLEGNSKIIEEVLCPNSMVSGDCAISSLRNEELNASFLTSLNASQVKAVLTCLYKTGCEQKSSVELIWGPPGTGKTKTISVFLLNLLKKNCKTITVAPTNVAIVEVASRVLDLVKELQGIELKSDGPFFSLGDVLLFGNEERLKFGTDVEEIYLEYRVKKLVEFLDPLTGWRHCFASMIDFLKDCVCEYHCKRETKDDKLVFNSFLNFARERFISVASPLRMCLSTFCTHIPKKCIMSHNYHDVVSLNRSLECFENLLFQENIVSEKVEQLFTLPTACFVYEDLPTASADFSYLFNMRRSICLSVLEGLRCSLQRLDLPSVACSESIESFCLQNASLLFCTASSSSQLHSMSLKPFKILVIDEAAQLKECESMIPLQLPDIEHVVLIGDKCQLPAMVESKLADGAGFGRSLFQRLTSLGHPRHLLKVQYRMHPSISFFPNLKFYYSQISDGPNVKSIDYRKNYLLGSMFGPYSFININDGREERDYDGHSRRNMLEVAVVWKIVQSLYKAWTTSNEKLSVGVISPYSAQVTAIQEKLGRRYDDLDGFKVKVKSVDGFQGGEEDIIIISTVRANSDSSIGFLSNNQRTNVALTRARYCLWILGHDKTLSNSDSVWANLIFDAKNRGCFFNVDDDVNLSKVVLDAKKEYDQFDDLLEEDSILFRCARWKVLFSDRFLSSFQKLSTISTKKKVLYLLLKLSSGWRPKMRHLNLSCASSTRMLKHFKVERLYVVCAIDIIKKSAYMQALRIWDILPLEDIPKLVQRLKRIFGTYTADYINCCQEICYEGKLEVPVTWVSSLKLVQYKSEINGLSEESLKGASNDCRSYVESSKVRDSLLLMKFYSLSSGVFSRLLSDGNSNKFDLLFEVTEEEFEIINYPRSTFVLGRSGTGKTTVLIMKLFQKEKLYHLAAEYYGVKEDTSLDVGQKSEILESPAEANGAILRQIFLTVSSKLCYAVRQHVSCLKSHACGGNVATASVFDMENMDDLETQFMDVPDSLANIPPKSYPLVITFYKFLLMLDGTLHNSFFERFYDAKQLLHGQIRSSRSVAFQNLIRKNEVNYDRFSSSYWPHFNTHLTKKLDCSRVFTEIISHIKGDPQAIDNDDGKLRREDYVSLSEGRISSLSRLERELIYDIFQSYEKLKRENHEFDLADFVIDLHHRLRDQGYAGDEIDFIYIDEVQDLTMSQIALFSYVCNNIEDGFVFSGDTAQTIAKGIDFRFQDIKSLFYREFVLPKRGCTGSEREHKGQISEIFHLSQNFRTHTGVLNLSQSIIELLYHFFPQSIDILKPETSRISGEAPVLLEHEDHENAIKMIFGNKSGGGCNMKGFGAEQVILVRDDTTQKEIFDYIGKKSLVLTILESKGLEFQDVLLYNFFGSSPLKNKWRVIFNCMEEQGMVDFSLRQSLPQFSESKHSILCSELKQLYVAVTRTKQRLWFLEDIKEHSGPMFEYWKLKGVVEVQKVDDSFAQSMQAPSSRKEWRSRGIKLYHEKNYKMATFCFERAEDSYWERRSEASGLKAYAEHIRYVSPIDADAFIREAAEIFEAIGMVVTAAQCFLDIGEFERAGKIFLEKCGESELDRAGECFYLAKCYNRAADVYARGNRFSECLQACTKGKLFDVGLEYILSWKLDCRSTRNKEIEELERKFLENCVLHYQNCGDRKSMMKLVKTFLPIDLMRKFLKSLNCLDGLLFLEEDLGNFLEAANIAKLRGDFLHVADLLGKAGKFYEASMLLIQYVLAYSLWSPRSKGWPLKQFEQNKEILGKAKSFAENDSKSFYECICTKADILSDEDGDLKTMSHYLTASRKHNSVTGEMISIRKILDAHLELNPIKYTWEDKLVPDLTKHSEEMILKNQLSIETMVHFWNSWKDNSFKNSKSLRCLATQDANPYGEFCLNFFGVWRQDSNYILLNSNADWISKVDERFLHRNGKLVSIGADQFFSFARTYWCSELVASGIKVLEKIESLGKFSDKNQILTFCQCMLFTHMFEVAKFLLESESLIQKNHEKTLERFCKLAKGKLQSFLFPPSCHAALNKNVISFRANSACRNLMNEIIAENIGLGRQPTYGQVGRVTMMILGSGKLDKELSEKIAKWLGENPPWNAFIEELDDSKSSENQQSLSLNDTKSATLVLKFHDALGDTYSANWLRERDYISPFCFMYLVERLLIMVASFQGYFVTTKSSFVEWLVYHQGNTDTTSSIMGAEIQCPFRATLGFLADILLQFLFNMEDTLDWTRNTHGNVDYYPALVRKLVVVTCLLHINFGICSDILNNLLECNFITEHLPSEFFRALERSLPIDKINMFAEFFKGIGNPMVVVSLAENHEPCICRDAIFIDMRIHPGLEDILMVLFPKEAESSQSLNRALTVDGGIDTSGKVFSSSSPNSASEQNKEMKSDCESGGNLSMLLKFWEIFEALSLRENERDQLSNASKIKMDVEEWIHHLTVARTKEQEIPLEDGERFLLLEVDDILHDLKLLSTTLSISQPEKNVSIVESISKSLYSKRIKLEPILNKLLNEDGKAKAYDSSASQNAEDYEHGKQACDSGHAEIAEVELEPVKDETVSSQVKSSIQNVEDCKTNVDDTSAAQNVEDYEHGEQACDSGYAEITEDVEPVVDETVSSQVKSSIIQNEEDYKTKADDTLASQNAEDYEHGEQACDSGHAEITEEVEPVEDEAISSQVKSNIQVTDNKGKGKQKPKKKVKKKKKGKGSKK